MRTSKDLRISGPAYNTSLAIYFVGYVIFEVPSNVSSTTFITSCKLQLKTRRSCEPWPLQRFQCILTYCFSDWKDLTRNFGCLRWHSHGALPRCVKDLSLIRLDCSALDSVCHYLLKPCINKHTESFTSPWSHRSDINSRYIHEISRH